MFLNNVDKNKQLNIPTYKCILLSQFMYIEHYEIIKKYKVRNLLSVVSLFIFRGTYLLPF